jgi:hypothetical protein
MNLKGNGKALSRIKKKGIEITETIFEPNIAFVWDTTINVFKLNPGILKYPRNYDRMFIFISTMIMNMSLAKNTYSLEIT